jgi:hypothetical protein
VDVEREQRTGPPAAQQGELADAFADAADSPELQPLVRVVRAMEESSVPA